MRPLALAELTRRGLAPEDAAALDAVAGELAARRDIAALATARGRARQGRREDASTAPGLVQVADSGESVTDADGEEESQDRSQTPDRALADWVQQELDALGIVPEDARYSAVPDTMAMLAKGTTRHQAASRAIPLTPKRCAMSCVGSTSPSAARNNGARTL